MLALFPFTGEAAPQNVDITKPTRERVKSDKKDKKGNSNDKNSNKNSSNKSNDKRDNSQEKKAPETKAPEKKAPEKKAPEKKAEPAVVKKEEPKPATGKQEAPNTKPDTANKPAEPKPKVRTTTDPAKVQFDGIDVSKHQGTINWGELKNQPKIKFVYIKATEGSDYVDPKYKENLHNARKHGFKVGSYHFLSTRSSAITQFQNFINNVKREEQDLIPVIDVERLKPWSAQQLRDSLKVFADLLEDYYGCKPLIYTSEKFFTTHLGRAFADYPLFIAKYNTTQPNIGYKWIMWQFADNGLFKNIVKGNYGEVDLSRFNKGYSINDIIYKPSKTKPKNSVRDAVDHKDKPDVVNMEQPKVKETPKMSKKQQEEAKKQAEKEKKAKERNKKMAEEEKKKKAEDEKKAREKQEQLKKEKERQQAREAAAKKEAEEKAKRKAAAQKAREEKAKQTNKKQSTSKKPASLMQTSASKLNQSQRNDSIRAAKLNGRKTNKSSADND